MYLCSQVHSIYKDSYFCFVSSSFSLTGQVYFICFASLWDHAIFYLCTKWRGDMKHQGDNYCINWFSISGRWYQYLNKKLKGCSNGSRNIFFEEDAALQKTKATSISVFPQGCLLLSLLGGWGGYCCWSKLSSHIFSDTKMKIVGPSLRSIHLKLTLRTFPAVEETTNEAFLGLEKLQHLLTDVL